MKKGIFHDPQEYQCCLFMLVAPTELFSSMIQVRKKKTSRLMHTLLQNKKHLHP
jgi:hypothetical protein